MKNLFLKTGLFFSVLSLVTFTTSCKKDKTKTIDLEINYKVGSEDFSYEKTYTIGGTAIKFDLVQFYVSGIHVMDDDGNTGTFDDKYLLVKPKKTTYALGELPENFESSHIHMLKFDIGVDATTNSQTESSFMNRGSKDPLAAQTPSMHWSWNSGYVFMKIDAQVDTTGDGVVDESASFHIGTNDFLRNNSTMIHRDLDNGANTIALNFNVAKLFEGVALSTDYSTHTMDNKPLATKIADNIANAFSKAN